jgi:DNA modification methylase
MKIGEFELNKTYYIDCLEGMKKIPDKSINLIFTSVPFKEEDIGGGYWELLRTS